MVTMLPPVVKVTSLSLLFDGASSSAMLPSQSLSLPSHTSGEEGSSAPLQMRLLGCELSQAHTPVPAQGPVPKMQLLPMAYGSSTKPSQSLSRVSQFLV